MPVISPPQYQETTDTPIVASEADALAHLHQVDRPVLLSYLTRLTKGDVHWAEDILQETLIKAWKNPKARNEQGRWSRGWLITVARRMIIDQVRSAKARPLYFSDELMNDLVAPEDGLNRMLDATEVRAALSALPERLRSVLVEMYIRERSVAEAAEVLQVPGGTVKSRNFYAIRALRDALSNQGFIVREPSANVRGRTG